MNRKRLVFGIILSVLLFDQGLKIWVKLNMLPGYLGQVEVFNWFYIHFTENNGMAFGMTLADMLSLDDPASARSAEYWGKLTLSLFRIIAIGAIGVYLMRLIKNHKEHIGLAISIGLIFAGALGNILDSAFYGLIFSDSGSIHNPEVARLFPEGGGYAGFLHGSVVDMLYFPIIKNGMFPEWIPFIGGDHFTFFRPIFNIADVSITVGVILIILFHKRFFIKQEDGEIESTPEEQVVDAKDSDAIQEDFV